MLIRKFLWRPTITLSAVLPHEGMLPGEGLSFHRFIVVLRFYSAVIEGCGHVGEGCDRGQRKARSAALSTVAPGAPPGASSICP